VKVNEIDLPWFKFFPWDWLTSETIPRFSLEQEAVYMRLLMRQWVAKNGYLPTDPAELQRCTRLDSAQRWRKVGKPVLDECFERRNGHYVNDKLRALWEDARESHEAKKKAAHERWKRERGE
jgi:uncharacterized protein YdaU (DUF1376 family)